MKKQTKVPFTEELAREVMQRHPDKVTLSVVKVWRTRGHIPGAYFDEQGFDESGSVHEKDPVAVRLLEILGMPEIASTKFRGGQHIADAALGKASLTKADIVLLKVEIAEIKNKVRKAIDTRQLRNIKAALEDIRLHPTKVVPAQTYARIADAKDLISDQVKNEAILYLSRLNSLLRI